RRDDRGQKKHYRQRRQKLDLLELHFLCPWQALACSLVAQTSFVKASICRRCRSILSCCPVTALMSRMFSRSYLTPATSPFLSVNVNEGATRATSSAASPTSWPLPSFQSKLTGRSRLMTPRPSRNGSTWLLKRKLEAPHCRR